MADSNFVIKNGLVVNSYFTVNSTSHVYTVNTFTIGTAAYVVSNGNFGIGIGSPAHKLSVNGNSYFSGAANVTGNVSIGGISYINGNMIVNASAGINANGSYGTLGQALLSNGTSVYWATATAGSNTHIQFNDSGTANASAGFIFNKVTNNVTVANSLTLGNNLTLANSIILGNITITNTGISGNTFAIGTAAYHIENGNFGIGNNAPAAKLHVQGDVVVSGDITSAYSDDRLKTRIANIADALEKVKQLNGFAYVPSDLGIAVGIVDGASLERKVGVSAQEVQKVLPEAVKPSVLNPEYLTVQYEKLVPLLIEAIKELEAKVNNRCKNCSCGGN